MDGLIGGIDDFSDFGDDSEDDSADGVGNRIGVTSATPFLQEAVKVRFSVTTEMEVDIVTQNPTDKGGRHRC